MRKEGGAPATSNRSLADRSTTCSSHERRSAVCSSERRERGAPAFSSVTSVSRSSGSVTRGLVCGYSRTNPQQRRVQESGERCNLPENGEERAVELRARGKRPGEFGPGEETPELQVLGRRMIPGKAAWH